MEAKARNSALSLLAVLAIACSRTAPDEPQGERATVPSSSPVEPKPEPPPRPALAPPKTPPVPPQLLICGRQEFYRITPRALEVFEIARELPPPQIRGSRVARKTTEVLVADASNVVRLADGSALVISKTSLLGHRIGQKEAKRFSPIDAAGPLFGWAGPTGTLRVHAEGARQISEFALGLPEKGGPAKGRVDPLPEFDGRLFTVLASGEPLYSTGHGLVRGASKPKAITSGEIPASTSLLFADPARDAYWLADAAGNLERRLLTDAGPPTSQAKVPGVLIDTASSSTHLAVLSTRVDGTAYRPTVTLFANGKELTRRDLVASVGVTEQPSLDLCVIEGRSWVVVGAQDWLKLIELETPRLLAEW